MGIQAAVIVLAFHMQVTVEMAFGTGCLSRIRTESEGLLELERIPTMH